MLQRSCDCREVQAASSGVHEPGLPTAVPKGVMGLPLPSPVLAASSVKR